MFLEPINFAQMYREHKATTDFKAKTSSDWDKKSSDMAQTTIDSPYVNDFISRMNIAGDEVVLDIGCGPGTLAIPLAKRVKEVIAIDFSEGMLDELKAYAVREGVTNIKTYHIGWEDDWSTFGKVDIVIASRSMEVSDIELALSKMSAHASKACYLTYKVGGSFVDMNILDFIGKKVKTKPDYWYIPIILYSHGYLPRIDYIETGRGSIRANTEDEFIESLLWSVHELDEEQKNKARQYYRDVIVVQNHHPRAVNWAFIGWETSL
ncbi:class I SAM-dependent methyltransferase [Sulfuricurvum sp.]|uniref:class I SAM-dependent methyltransferase n=1 Tax=Sulfuricurvum sp. TaxID=2025608 RepID=UPI0019BC18B0|nr:class I SAM-dependent methyltransferase [Sulfuricurvum sp.]MBD3798967.1 class I SAM-dependent methyltransferase [Campylobacterota bacterium]MBD3806483.1 class I SAM-dependent methyltransferase [Sulfuricurvum sp.]